MNNQHHTTVLNLHRFAPGRSPERAARSGSFDAETTVTFVRKEAERTLNDAAFVDNMSKE